MTRPTWYVLGPSHELVPATGAEEAARFMGRLEATQEERDARYAKSCRVGDTTIGTVRVSTIFLGCDQAMDGPPILFETRTFASDDDTLNAQRWRYTTWEEAEQGHTRAVGWVTSVLARRKRTP